MKFLNYATVLVTMLLFAIAVPAYSQNPETTSGAAQRTIGLSANIQNSEFGITIPIFMTQRFSLAPAIGLRYAENVGTNLAIGLVPKLYFATEKFAPFSTLRVGALINSPSGADREIDFLLGIGTGAEYFLAPNFSFGVEGQLNSIFYSENSNRFGNPNGMNVNLATVVTANIYFTR